MFEVKIYIETSLKGPLRAGEGEGWYAAVVEYRKKDGEIETREDFVREEKTTYHKSVLCAFLKSLKRLNKECVLEVHTDSTFLNNNCKNGNLEMWKTNGWKTIKGENVAHKELWQQISVELDKHKAEFVWERRKEYSLWMMEQAKIRLKSPKSEGDGMGRKWTEKERKYVKENWGKIPTQVMSLKIDRTESAIKSMVWSVTSSEIEEKRKSYEEQRRNTAKKRQQCKTCIYRAYQGRGCDYILLTGKRRGCSPENCDKYTKGKKKRMANEPAWQGR